MLKIDLRVLREGKDRTDGEVAPDDPLLAGVGFQLSDPVVVRGRLTDCGPGRYYWRATLVTKVATSCRRCLAEVLLPVRAEVSVLFAEDPEVVDDPATYPVSAEAIELDLGPAAREELILAVPEYVVCREDCRGLCPQCGKDLNDGPCVCRPEPDPRWAALEALKGRGGDTEES